MLNGSWIVLLHSIFPSNLTFTSFKLTIPIFLNYFVRLRSILWSHWLPLFWTSCDPPHGFQSQGGSLTCTLTRLPAVNLRVMSGATPAFSTNRGVHCTSVYTAGMPSRHPSYKQWRAGQATVAIPIYQKGCNRANRTSTLQERSFKKAKKHNKKTWIASI